MWPKFCLVFLHIFNKFCVLMTKTIDFKISYIQVSYHISIQFIDRYSFIFWLYYLASMLPQGSWWKNCDFFKGCTLLFYSSRISRLQPKITRFSLQINLLLSLWIRFWLLNPGLFFSGQGLLIVKYSKTWKLSLFAIVLLVVEPTHLKSQIGSFPQKSGWTFKNCLSCHPPSCGLCAFILKLTFSWILWRNDSASFHSHLERSILWTFSRLHRWQFRKGFPYWNDGYTLED